MNFFEKHSRIFFVIVGYLALTFALTYPTIFQFGRAIPIAGGDVYQVAAKINDQAYILQQKGIGAGLSQIYSEGKLTMNTLAALVERAGLPLLATYNLFLLFSFFASALGAYLLAFYFTRNAFASFIAGIIFAFAPFHTYQVMTGHSGTLHQEWLPFFVLFLWKWFDTKKTCDAIFSSIFLALIAITEHHLLAFTTIFIALFIFYQMIFHWKSEARPVPWKFLLVLGGGLLIIIFALFGPYVKIAVSDENYLDPGLGQVQRYSMPLLDPLVTPPWQTFWPGFRATLISAFEEHTPFKFKNIGEGNSSAYISYTALFLIALFLLTFAKNFRRENDRQKNAVILFWIGVVLVFYVFSIGPLVKIGSLKIYTPYFLLYKFAPFFKNIRTVDRFFVFALLGFSLLAAFSITWLHDRSSKRIFWAITSVATLMIIIELMQIPFGGTTLAYSPFYDRLAKEQGSFRIIEIPGSSDYDYGSFLRFTNTIHHKESLSGIVTGRELPGQYAFQKNTPLVSALLYDLPKNKMVSPDANFSDAITVLKRSDVRYITVSQGYMKQSARDAVIAFINKWITADVYYQDGSIIVFRIP